MDIGLDAVGNGDIPSFVVANDTDTALVATIVATPNYDNNGFTCVGDPETFTITVNPGAQVNPVLSQVLCIGDSTDEIIFTTTNTDGTTTYNWTNDNTNIGLAASGTGDILSFTPSLVLPSSEIALTVNMTFCRLLIFFAILLINIYSILSIETHSTVTDFAKFLGLSTSVFFLRATW